MIWSWPGRTPAQAVRPELISFYDFFPSVAEAAGVELPANRGLTGRSYVPLATGKPLPARQRWPATVFGHFRNTEMARDNRYKLVLRDAGAGPGELYDLREDPFEKRNLYNNAQFVTVKDRLTGELAGWRKRVS
jgi:arylsulfatase A-like enzyme